MKTRLGLIFGGRSSEHEISILSAASVLSEIDRGIYEPVPFIIDKSGQWYLAETNLAGLETLADPRISKLKEGARKVTLSDFDEMTDFAFPLLHGPYGEDGTIQGLFEMLGKPYAGCGVAASAVSMDKILTKGLWTDAGLPVSKYTHTTEFRCRAGLGDEAKRIETELSYPVFVKPANMGSSVGICKADDLGALERALSDALKYDRRVIAEQAVSGRELEIGVIGNETAELSAVGEILPQNEFYDYESKYRGEGTRLVIPAEIPEKVKNEIESLAKKAYAVIDGEGFSRIDLFYDEKKEKIYLNEMNAIPGFTKYSMFPLLWRSKDVMFGELIERIIRLGYERHNAAYRR